jgi:rubrerythrin
MLHPGLVMFPFDSKTGENLTEAFGRESQASHRFLYFAKVAKATGHDDIAQALRLAVADGIDRARVMLEFLWEIDNPLSGPDLRSMGESLHLMLHRRKAEFSGVYWGMARTARDEGFDEVARWLEMLAKTERSRAEHFQRMLARWE